MLVNRFAAIILAASLTGCAGLGEGDSDTVLASACSSYGAALSIAADNFDRLEPSQRTIVESTRNTVPDLCDKAANDKLSDPDAALEVVENAYRQIQPIAEEYADAGSDD
jgi:hypothetical protein